MPHSLTRRQWLATTLGLPTLTFALPGLATEPLGPTRAWNRPIPLGNSGLKVTPLGLGCEGVKDPKLIRQAADLGITHFNSFPNRGDISNFGVVGDGLRPVRSQVVLATGSSRRAPAEFLEDLDRQLLALKTSHIDIFYLLAVGKPEFLSDEVLGALHGAVKAGKISAAAVSTHGFANILSRLLETGSTFRALMVTCNFASWDSGTWAEALPAIRQLRKAGVGIVAMKSLMGGMGSSPEGHAAIADALKSDDGRRTVMAAALRWVVHHELVDTVPAGVDSLEQLQQNIRAVAEGPSESDRKLLVSAVDALGPNYCRLCPRCTARCSAGLPVADLMRWLTYAEGYHDIARARAAFSELHPALQQVRCTECGTCTATCPNGVRLQANLARAQRLLAAA